MPAASDHDATLRQIAELATEAAARADVPAAIHAVLARIAELAGSPSGDTPGPSDIPRTENQSL